MMLIPLPNPIRILQGEKKKAIPVHILRELRVRLAQFSPSSSLSLSLSLAFLVLPRITFFSFLIRVLLIIFNLCNISSCS